LSLVSSSVPADECLKYKTLPSLKIKVPSYSVSVVQPDRKMNLLHGNVVATMAEEYEIEYGARKIDGGYCVFIEHITATIGYTDFVVQIDRRHSPESCEFAGILEHEYEHIHAHLAVIDDEKKDIEGTIRASANNVLPLFVPGEDGIDGAMADLETALQNQPQILLLREKLVAAREIRDKKIDLNDKGDRIRDCIK
jgi:hypothetical protein